MTAIDDVLGGRYRLISLLGHGGMSDVYQARDERTGDDVALKIVRSSDPEFTRRLTQEAVALEGFEHPGLIRLLDTGLDGDQAYLVMELVQGASLAETLRHGPLSSRDSAALGARLAGALAYIHARGVVHRDVKPSNVLLGPDGAASLSDFGIARHDDASTRTATGTILGTVSYMAPEQLEDHAVGPGADIWSLGIVLLECLTGRRVYEGAPSDVVARRLAGPVPIPGDLPVAWKIVLTGMLDHRVDQRLDGSQVASLLDTPAFDAEWSPLDEDATTIAQPVVGDDVTSLMPGVVVASPATSDATMIAPAGFRVARVRPRRPHMRPVLVALIVALAIALFIAFNWNPSLTPPKPTTRPPVATTTTRATTTTVASASADALANLVRDATSGQSAGTVDSDSVKQITQQAQMAITDNLAGNTSQVANDLQQAVMALAQGIQHGSITAHEGVILQRDLNALAASLGLRATDAPPTSQHKNPKGKSVGH